MAKPFTLYWTNLSRWEDCPQKFLWYKGWGAIDVGGGPGRKKPVPYQRSAHHMIMGIVIAEVLEIFYNNELWRMLKDRRGLQKKLAVTLDNAWKRALLEKYIDWRKAPPRDEMRQICEDGVYNFVWKTLKAQRLLGVYARAEVDLVAYANKYTPIGGRADLIIRREVEPNKGVLLLDGKNSRRYKDRKTGGWMTYTDPDQLRWYALLYYLCYQQFPDLLGFIYFRYPHGVPILDPDGKDTGKLEEGIDWVEFSRDDLKGLKARAIDARKGMDKERFDARPRPPMCRMCDYESVCPQRQAQIDKNRRNPRKGTLDVLEGADGFVDFQVGSSGAKKG